jgi:hypothetical protein
VIASAALACALLAATPAPGGRVALLVANEQGLSMEAALRFPAQDAARLASVLEELGDFSHEDIHTLSGKSADEVLSALDSLAHGPRSSLFFFYYSGHADSSALHLAGTTLPVDKLLEGLQAIPAELRIGLIDACQSGSVTRAKGVVPGPAFDLRVDEGSEGQILVSSSAADEQSFESDAHGGALFTLHWVAALRGAADSDGDSTVTLTEAYRYAYAQTLRATLLSNAGPQHPSFKMDLSGRHDPVLTRLNASANLTLSSEDDGDYVIFDGAERQVILEVPARAAERLKVALAPGAYVVKKRGTRGVRLARIELARGDDRLLADYQMRPVPLVRLARKGGLGDLWATARVGQVFTGLGVRGLVHVDLGVELETSWWLLGAQVQGSIGNNEAFGLSTRYRYLGLQLSAMPSVHLGAVALRAGPALGLYYLDEQSTGRALVKGVGSVGALQIRIEVEVTRNLSLVANGNAGGLLTRVAPHSSPWQTGDIAVLYWADYGFGLRAAW